eukprot:SAG22_NODE_1725_length_3714_cov_3.037621_3_plen_60_part_01
MADALFDPTGKMSAAEQALAKQDAEARQVLQQRLAALAKRAAAEFNAGLRDRRVLERFVG